MVDNGTRCPACGELNPEGTRYCGACGSPVSQDAVLASARVFPEGAAIREYRVVRMLGEGGMGQVYLAEHEFTGQKVAVKAMLPEFASREVIKTRFFEEARIMAMLQHPAIVRLYAFFEESGRLFAVMEYVDGPSLTSLLKARGPLDVATVLAISEDVLSALAYAHSREPQVVHRDIKPANVLLDSSAGAHVSDFGIARAADSQKLTRTGAMVGTLEYVSPEQARGAAVPQSDIYSWGVTVYHMLAGRPPFQQTSDTGVEVLLAHAQEPPPPLASLRPDLPPAFVWAVHKALAKDPAARFATADLFMDALKSTAGILPSAAAAVPGRATPTLLRQGSVGQALPSPVEGEGSGTDRRGEGSADDPRGEASGTDRRGEGSGADRRGEGSGDQERALGRASVRGRGAVLWLGLGLGLAAVAVGGVVLVSGLGGKGEERMAPTPTASAPDPWAGRAGAGGAAAAVPVAAPVKAPEAPPVKAPEAAPVKAPEAAPVKAPEAAPVKASEAAPVKVAEATPVPVSRGSIYASASSQDDTVNRKGTIIDYSPANVLDGDMSTAWVEGKKGTGLNEWIELRFDSAIKLKELHLWNGYQKYVPDNLGDRYYINERLERVEVRTDAGSRIMDLADTKDKQVLRFDGSPTRSVRLTIKSVYGSKYKDCAISEVRVYALAE